MNRISPITTVTFPIIALLVVLAIWQAMVSVGELPAILLPGPIQVIRSAIEQAPKLGAAALMTFIAAFGGLLLSLFAGTAIAMLFSQSSIFRQSFYPYAIFLQTVPIVAIAPIVVIWFGEGTMAVVVIAFVVSLFPIISNGTTGMTSIPRELQELFVLNGATRWQRLCKLQLPHAVPHLVTGLKVSAGLSVLGAIVGEFFAGAGASRPGLGYLVFAANRQLKMDFLFAAVFTCTLLGVVMFGTISWIGDRYLLHWMDRRVGD